MRTDKSFFEYGKLKAHNALRKDEQVVERASHLIRVFSHLRSSNEPVVSAKRSSLAPASCFLMSDSTRRPKTENPKNGVQLWRLHAWLGTPGMEGYCTMTRNGHATSSIIHHPIHHHHHHNPQLTSHKVLLYEARKYVTRDQQIIAYLAGK